MSKKSHTPTPWRVEGESIVTDETCIAVIEDDGGYEAPYEEREANAELICASVNSYAKLPDPLEAAKSDLLGQLIVALKSVTDEKADWLAHEMDHRNKDHSKWWKAVEKARALIATKERKP